MTTVLTTTEAADLLKVPAETLRYWRSTNRGPAHFRAGKYVRYTQAAIEQWVAANTTQPRRAS